MAFLSPFPRTECACTGCIKFCKTTPGFLVPGDLFSIADFLLKEDRITTRQGIFEFLRASKGAVVGEAATGKRFRIGTITPKLENGRCVFLTIEDRCSIHAVSPHGCSRFDSHMDTTEGDIRSMWGLKQIISTPAYETLRQKLIKDSGEQEPFDSSSSGNNGQQKES